MTEASLTFEGAQSTGKEQLQRVTGGQTEACAKFRMLGVRRVNSGLVVRRV